MKAAAGETADAAIDAARIAAAVVNFMLSCFS